MLCSARSMVAALALLLCAAARFAAADTITVVPDSTQKLVHEGDAGLVGFTVTSLSSAKITINSVAAVFSFLSGKDPVAGGKDADELFAAEIVFDFCSGATLLNTNTCTFREAFLTRDAQPDTDVDTAQWLIGAAVRFHVDDNQQGDLKVGSFRVDVTDAPVPEPSTLSLCITAMLCIAVLALRRRGAGRGLRLFGSGSS